jgi:hypothetical protein
MTTQLIRVYVTSVLPLSDQSLAATFIALFAAKNKFRHKPEANITFILQVILQSREDRSIPAIEVARCSWTQW